ncbi:MAG: hypothetical protein IPL33_17085 [Sphingobacteriales bacterium]|nr:hypothetical protein [Sphingobacteriales bacterium]MCC7222685.1 hypothetical protein [Chitinophagales bacterium]
MTRARYSKPSKTQERTQRKESEVFFGGKNNSSFFGNGKTSQAFFGRHLPKEQPFFRGRPPLKQKKQAESKSNEKEENNNVLNYEASDLVIQHKKGTPNCQCPACIRQAKQLKTTQQQGSTPLKETGNISISKQIDSEHAPIQGGFWSSIKNAAKSAVGWVGDKVSSAASWVGNKASSAIGWISDKAQSVGSWIKNGLSNILSACKKKGAQAFGWLGSKIGATWNWLRSKGSAAIQWLKKGGSWLWNGLKKVGAFAKKIAGKVWNGLKWVGSPLWSKLKAIYQRVGYFITQLPTRLKRLVLHIWDGVKSLKPWSLSWWESLGQLGTWKNIGSWFGKLVVYGLETLGIGEIYQTIADIIKFNTVPLTGSQIAIAKEVYGNSINYNLVRVDRRALIGPSWTGRDYTSFHTINGWGTLSSDVLIHELGHVWQYERMGAMYMPQAIHDQITMPQAYDYGGVAALEANKTKGIWAFGREQQAQIFQDYYRIKHGMLPEQGSATVADLPLYEHYINEIRR